MNGIHHITLENKQYGIRFNNYARAELRKFFMKEGEFQLTETQLTERIIEKWKENDVLLLKIIVYAGIVGDSLVKHDTPLLTREEVGAYIGEADEKELYDIWKTFLDAQGIGLNKEAPKEQKKKKATRKKKTQTKNS